LNGHPSLIMGRGSKKSQPSKSGASSSKASASTRRPDSVILDADDDALEEAIRQANGYRASMILLDPEGIQQTMDAFNKNLYVQDAELTAFRKKMMDDASRRIAKIERDFAETSSLMTQTELRAAQCLKKAQIINEQMQTELLVCEEGSRKDKAVMIEMQRLLTDTMMCSTSIVSATQLETMHVQQESRRQRTVFESTMAEMRARQSVVEDSIKALTETVLENHFNLSKALSELQRSVHLSVPVRDRSMFFSTAGTGRSAQRDAAQAARSRESSLESVRSQKYEEVRAQLGLHSGRIQAHEAPVFVRAAQIGAALGKAAEDGILSEAAISACNDGVASASADDLPQQICHWSSAASTPYSNQQGAIVHMVPIVSPTPCYSFPNII